REREHASAHQCLQREPVLCEACRHWGPSRGWVSGHCLQPSPDSQTPRRAIGDSYMDIGYFLKLMTEKNASDMFLTTGAPVYIKVEGKLYPLGNTGLPSGMVKKIAYSLMDEGQVPQFERDLELNMAISLQDS